MITPGSIFINILVFLTASLYWVMSGHFLPAILGYIFVILYMYDEKLYFISDIVAILALFGVIIFFYIDYTQYKEPDSMVNFGVGVLYMIVIYLKTRAIFNND